ncbi:MAG: 3-hydroxyacyl-CoA dehydrogenase NAD-binding domain-containing protein [Gammaproteobacteria bacterium]
MSNDIATTSPSDSGSDSEIPTYRHWQLEINADGILLLSIDCAGQSTNTLSEAVLEEFESIVEWLRRNPPQGLILQSKKSTGFIVGADISEFDKLTDPRETEQYINRVHKTLNKLERFRFPTVAKIFGFCLGGGLEIALACDYRVASDDAKTKLGFPEILLGIHPGFAGTVRSIEKAGVAPAMDLMLTGKSIDARRAKRIGLVDHAVPMRHLDRAALQLISNPPKAKKQPLAKRASNTAVTRPVVAALLRKQVAKRAAEQHYPAPYALIRLWQEHGGDRVAMMQAEAASIARLFVSPTSKNLQRLFFLQERLKGFGRAAHGFKPTRVHVIGAGTMGGDIAAWCAGRGMQVTLQDREIKYVAPAIKRAHATYDKRIRDPYRRQHTKDNLVIDIAGDGIARADVIIEAIIEDLEAKQALFKEVEQKARPDAVIATNTSSIPLEDIAVALNQPSRLVGIHFFNPVARMQLVEIISSDDTSQDIVDRANAFTVIIDKQPLPAKSAPGFLINRILSPYLQEAMLMLDEGLAVAEIDKAATDFGMPMGPLELADTVGLEICRSVGEVLAAKLGGESPQVLTRMVNQKWLGKKTERGFYEYKRGKIVRPKYEHSNVPINEIRDRMVLRLINEAVACLREEVVSDADLVDVGMVFGTGFAPFRGGPLNYARSRGLDEVVERLEYLAERVDERFLPDPGWALLKHGKSA